MAKEKDKEKKRSSKEDNQKKNLISNTSHRGVPKAYRDA
jgi:hypothetical protein